MFDTALFRRMTDENLSGCAFGVLSLQAADEIDRLRNERDHFRELATALAEGKIGVARVFLDKTLFWPVTSKHGSLDNTVDYPTALAAAEAALEKLKEQPCK